jgi:hypothetical protein
MNQMVVAVFANEGAALDGLRELRDLHREGGISLYASATQHRRSRSGQGGGCNRRSRLTIMCADEY